MGIISQFHWGIISQSHPLMKSMAWWEMIFIGDPKKETNRLTKWPDSVSSQSSQPPSPLAPEARNGGFYALKIVARKWWGDCNQKMERLKPTLGEKNAEKSKVFKLDCSWRIFTSWFPGSHFWSPVEVAVDIGVGWKTKRIKNQANQITVGHLDLSYLSDQASIKLYLDSVVSVLVTSNHVPVTSSLDPRLLSFFRMGFPLKK